MDNSSQVKKLTVAFPLYGQHQMVRRALTALIHQTNQDFKIICLDDQSPEPFDDLVAEFKNNLEIEIKQNPTNLGAMFNIWQSIQLPVETPYIMSHHADDYLKADYLEQAIKILETNSDISFVVTGPVWVAGDEPYKEKMLGAAAVDFFDAADFALNILKFAPYIFGSVVYRRDHLVADWKYKEMDTYCDRYFLGEILRTNNSRGAYINGNGIIEHDHSQDKSDNRSPKLNEDHAINLLSFYKKLLLLKYPRSFVNKIITNNTLYYFGNFENRSSLWSFYKKQKRYKLILFRKLNLMGIYSLFILPLNSIQKRKLFRLIKRLC